MTVIQSSRHVVTINRTSNPRGALEMKTMSMINQETGDERPVYSGFCWSILVLGPIVPMVRGDWLTCIFYVPCAVVMYTALLVDNSHLTLNIVYDVLSLFLAFKYNAIHIMNLTDRGYVPTGREWLEPLKDKYPVIPRR